MVPNNCCKCGTAYSAEQLDIGFATKDESLTCLNCGAKVWDNVIPVPVCVQSVIDPETGRLGLAIAQRAIQPRLGTWNLIAGHMKNIGETLEEAAIREWREETGIEPGILVGIIKSYANGPGHVLVAVEFEPITTAAWRQARLCPENSAFDIWWRNSDPAMLGFPLHQQMASHWSSAP